MPTLTDSGTDVDVTERIDLDGEVPCRVLFRGECGNEAGWAYRCPGCSRDFLACQFHRDAIDTWLESQPLWVVIRCRFCAAHVSRPLPWRTI